MPHALAARDPRIRVSASRAHKPRASAAKGLAVAEAASVAGYLARVLFVDNATTRAYPRLHGARCDVVAVTVRSCGWLWRWPQERALEVVPFVAFLTQIVSTEEAIPQRAGNNPRATPCAGFHGWRRLLRLAACLDDFEEKPEVV